MEYLRADLHTNYITPVADVFQVNHFDAPKIRPEGWTIKVGGLAKWQLDLTMADLEDMPHTEVTAFHECAGSPIHPHIPQRRIANIKWTGVPLALILREIGVDERARYVLSRGADGGTWQSMRHPSYEKDLPLAKALDLSVLLAVAMNDAPLSIGHGGPVRLVVPGYYGTNSTKWLRQILISAGRSKSAFTTTYYKAQVVSRQGERLAAVAHDGCSRRRRHDHAIDRQRDGLGGQVEPIGSEPGLADHEQPPRPGHTAARRPRQEVPGECPERR